PAAFRPDAAYRLIWQHFFGWRITTETDRFDRSAFTFMDFRCPQRDGLVFFYLLPISAREALAEVVGYDVRGSADMLRGYLDEALGVKDYRVTEREAGFTPLTDFPFPRRSGRRVMTIGIP